MSLRLHMLQVARLGARELGDSADLVRVFLREQIGVAGGGVDRGGKPDLYYTIFALAGLQALEEPLPVERTEPWLRSFEDGAGLDFVHLGALARCWSALGVGKVDEPVKARLLGRIEEYRSADGGYDSDPHSATGNAYGCFVGFGAYQDLGSEVPEPLRMVQCLKLLETPDGAWGNARKLSLGSTNATAAAVTLLHQMDMPINASVGSWLLAQAHPQGGFLAMPKAPIPDLLSTATALHALSCLEVSLPDRLRENCLDFLDTLWSAEGGFHGHWADDDLDPEYTFYGLLALGHLGVK